MQRWFAAFTVNCGAEERWIMSWVHINERSALQHNKPYTKFQIAPFSDLMSARSHITVSDLAQNLDNLLQQRFQTVLKTL